MNNYAITQHLPVSNHVYKYLCKMVGSDSYIVRRDDFLGKMVLSALTNVPQDMRPSSKRHQNIFNITIADHHYAKNGMFVSPKGAQLLNQMVDAKFREEMYTHIVLVNKYQDAMFLQEIRKYCESFGITEDDIKYDTIYREFKRKKEEFLKRIN